MTHRKRHMVNDAAATGPESEPPVPEAQGDGEPGPADVTDRAIDVEGDSEQISRELADQKDKFLRLAAEYDNYRKRTTKERIEAGSRGQAELVMRLLDGLDDLQRFAHVDPATADSQTLHKGIAMVEQKMLKALGALGLELINPVDQSFDPNVHEAVTTEPAIAPEDDNTVSQVFEPGYRFGSQLLRPARVVVKQWNQG